MKVERALALLVPFGLIACGTSSSTNGSAPGSSAALVAAAPTIASVSLSDGPVDNAVAFTGSALSTEPPGVGSPGDCRTPVLDDLCNPHLFVRSEEVVDRVNRHLYKFLVFVEQAIASSATTTSPTSVTFDVRRLDVQGSLTISYDNGIYDWTLGLSPLLSTSGSVAPIQVASGTVDTTGATKGYLGSGGMTLDLNALASVTPIEQVAGTLDVYFESVTGHREVSVYANDVIWDTDAPGTLPHSAWYVSYREPGVGGSLTVLEEADVPAACPSGTFGSVATPATSASPVPAEVQLVSRWYVATPATTSAEGVSSPSTSTTSVHGRTDAQFTGGRLGADSALVAVTCHEFTVASEQGAVSSGWQSESEANWLMQAEIYSLLKEENVNDGGATLWYREFGEVGACDPALAPDPSDPTVPAPANDSTDFPFASTSFTSGAVYPFPGGP